MLSDKLKNLIPDMEKFIRISVIDGMERGFTFRTNEEAKMEGICETGNECQMVIKDIKKREWTKTGLYHTHPYTTIKTKQTHGIGEIFSCGDVLVQSDNSIDYSCVGTKDEIVCSTLKSKVSIGEKIDLVECINLHHHVDRLVREKKGYKGSKEHKSDIMRLDRSEKELDDELKPYMHFEIIKKLK